MKRDALIQSGHDNYDADLFWTKEACNELRWWHKLPSPIMNSFERQPFTAEFTTDASLEGWGVVFNNQHFFGAWDNKSERINELEMRTILVALQVLPVMTKRANLHVYCDNTVAIAYMNHQGGKKLRLHQIARQIWDLLEEHDTFLTATYVPSAENVADQFTRGFEKINKRAYDLEVQLNPRVFRQHIRKSGPFSLSSTGLRCLKIPN